MLLKYKIKSWSRQTVIDYKPYLVSMLKWGRKGGTGASPNQPENR